MKKAVSSLLLCVFLFSFVLTTAGCALFNKENFRTVLRFAVASDVHVADGGSGLEERRLALMLERAYEYVENNPKGHKTLDAFLFVGDMTETGTLSQMQIFKQILDEGIREETRPFITLGNHEFYDCAEETVKRFEQAFGYGENEHIEINGFHFIRLSPDEGDHYGEEKQAWLAQELKAASEASPNMPIFVMQHHHVADTVYGSENYWGLDDLKDILAEYPQVVNFSGHSHFPINDPRSFWQGEFTAIGTGGLSYAEIGVIGEAPDFRFSTNSIGGWSSGTDWLSDDIAQFQIIEVGKKGQVRIIGYDLLTDQELFTRYVLSPADPTTFVTNEEKIAASDIPAFAPEAVVSVSNQTSKGFTLTIPQATYVSTPIESYRVEIYNKDGVCYGIYRVLSGYYQLPVTKHVRCDIASLSGAEAWTIKVWAINCYGLESEPFVFVAETI